MPEVRAQWSVQDQFFFLGRSTKADQESEIKRDLLAPFANDDDPGPRLPPMVERCIGWLLRGHRLTGWRWAAERSTLIAAEPS
jgi:hypothetical protein